MEYLELLGHHFGEDIVALLKHVLTSTYFVWNGQYYEQTDGVAIGSPVTAYFFMEDSEENVLEQATHKPLCWYCYVINTSVIWQHGIDKLKTLDFINNINRKMEMEDVKHLPFFDNDMYKRPDGTQGHRIHSKPTHMNLYLHPMSHHPLNKHAMLAALAYTTRAICDEDSLAQELELLKTTFRENGYNFKQILQVFSKTEKIPKDNKKPTSNAFLLYVQSVSGRLNTML
jgi:hypothetical protein